MCGADADYLTSKQRLQDCLPIADPTYTSKHSSGFSVVCVSHHLSLVAELNCHKVKHVVAAYSKAWLKYLSLPGSLCRVPLTHHLITSDSHVTDLCCSHLVGHEGEGSVFAVLKKLGWATSLSAGESGSSLSSRSVFMVHIELTDAGKSISRPCQVAQNKSAWRAQICSIRT